MAMMGGGVVGGRALGATDSQATPSSISAGARPRHPHGDIAATIYSALGIDWTKSITDTPSGRKFEYVPFGSVGTYVPINEVWG